MKRHALVEGSSERKKILLISSCGGHWIQMNRVLPAFNEHDVHFASTESTYGQLVPEGRFHCVPDSARDSNPIQIVHMALSVFWLLLKLRPSVVVSTGAAPGFFALFFGKCLRKKTVWIDSIANVHEVSMSGRKIAKFVDLYITQWEHLARDDGPYYYGSVV